MKKLILILLFPLLSTSQTYIYGTGKTAIKMTSTRDQKYYVQKTYPQDSEIIYVKTGSSSTCKKNKMKKSKTTLK